MRIRYLTSIGFALLGICLFGALFSASPVYAKENDFIISGKLLAGNIYLKSGNVSDALREFNTAYKSDPDNPDAIIGLVRCYSRIGQFEKAWDKITEFEQKRNYDMRSHLIKGEYLALKGHTEEAANEFMLLIEKGIYRFESLQALIRLYAQDSFVPWKRVIDSTIPLYEPINQITLYGLLREALDTHGKPEAAEEYARKMHVVSEMMAGNECGYSDVDPLEWTINNARRMMEQGRVEQAESLLAEASHRWPGENRIQALLKECYFIILQDTPISQQLHIESNVGEQASTETVSEEYSPASLMLFLPADQPLKKGVREYVTKVVSITTETEKYYKNMTNSMLALQSKMMSDVSSGKPTSCADIQRNLNELEILLNESIKVSEEEINVLHELDVPEGFQKFHGMMLDIAGIRTFAFKDIHNFVTTRRIEYMSRAYQELARGQQMLDEMVMEFQNAVKEQAQKPSESANQI